MTHIVRNSFLIIVLLLPFSASAESRAEIPTSIQVVDSSGKTLVSTGTQRAKEDERGVPFHIPSICIPFVQEKAKDINTPSLIPKQHVLFTRIESRREALRMLTEKLSFAPYLPQKEELSFKEHLRSLGTHASTSPTSLKCLFLLEEEFRVRGGATDNNPIQQISNTILGLQYGIANLNSDTIQLPRTEEEALYAGDLLVSRCPLYSSLSIQKHQLELDFLFPVRIFGRWERTAVAHLLIKEGVEAEIRAPWWAFFGVHGLSDIANVFHNTARGETGPAGMFLHAEGLTEILCP